MASSFRNLLKDIRACEICVKSPRGEPLPHAPRPVLRVSLSAKICVCGQAPGTRVHKSGRPFTDPSGDRLRDWMGVSDAEFYDTSRIAIIPMGFCFPGLSEKGGDLPPRRECAPAWRGPLFEYLENLQLMLLVGSYAQKWHLGPKCRKTLTETVQNWPDYNGSPEGPCFIPLPHPSWRNNAWLKKHKWFESDVLPFLKQEVRKLLK